MLTKLKHVAVIMDGNGRWAVARNKPRLAGHQAGVEKTKEVIRCAAESGVEELSLFTFSSENRKRPEAEVNSLMELLVESLRDGIDELYENGIQLKFIGDLSFFDQGLREIMLQSEQKTAAHRKMLLQIAVNYSGQWDIAAAVHKIMTTTSVPPQDTEALAHLIGQNLKTRDVDLLIRTGGEHRISNFFLWQSAYAELYFSATLWPDFSRQEFESILTWYAQRQRRFGLTSEQIDVDGVS